MCGACAALHVQPWYRPVGLASRYSAYGASQSIARLIGGAGGHSSRVMRGGMFRERVSEGERKTVGLNYTGKYRVRFFRLHGGTCVSIRRLGFKTAQAKFDAGSAASQLLMLRAPLTSLLHAAGVAVRPVALYCDERESRPVALSCGGRQSRRGKQDGASQCTAAGAVDKESAAEAGVAGAEVDQHGRPLRPRGGPSQPRL